jgi:CubicO group peptidase (beta-lactamase class C family)
LPPFSGVRPSLGISQASLPLQRQLTADFLRTGFGSRDLATGAPMTVEAVVWIASMTKALTAACAMQLVEQGKLALDAPIKSVLPELGQIRLLQGFDPSGVPRLVAPLRDVSLRHLLTHTAGFVYDIFDADMASYMAKTDTPGIISCQNKALTTPLVFEPGEQWAYGIGIDWVGKAVEAVSGLKLGQYMRQNLLDPLGMVDTGFRITAAQRRRLARVHARTESGFVSTDTEIPQDPEFEMGGGGLYSTVGDYLKFMQMILGGGTLGGAHVLKPETVSLMSKNAIGNLTCVPLKTAIPNLSNDVDFIDGDSRF